jgi:hypothetical protein
MPMLWAYGAMLPEPAIRDNRLSITWSNAMKRKNLSVRAQARRLKAFTRFTIDAERAAMDKKYALSKEYELQSLKKSLGV